MPTPNMSLTLPVDHGSADVWDTILDAIFNTIDAHDHTAGKGVQVPSAGLSIDADVSWSSGGDNFAITDLLALELAAVDSADVAGYAGAFFIDDADDELYFRTRLGVNVQVTDGGTLNVSAFTGGIGGDYAAVGALVSFDDATDAYWFQQQGSPRPWAGMRVGNLDIYEQAASITNRIRLQSPGALAASYAITLLSALPATQKLLQITAGGVLTATNVLANNENIELVGTGRVVHGSWIKTFTMHPDIVTAGSCSGGTDGMGGFGSAICAASTVFYSRIHGFLATDTITQVVLAAAVLSGVGTPTYDLMKRDNTGALVSVLAAPTTSTTLTPNGGGTVPGNGGTLYVRVSVPAATTYAYYTAAATFTG